MMDVNRSAFKGLLWCVFFTSGLCMSVWSPAEVSVVSGSAVSLSCSFSSSSRVTSLMSVDWKFKPQSGGPAKLFFHFSSVAYPVEDERFRGRVKWTGSPSGGDASIQLLNATQNDNGTFSCSVRNPPDIQGNTAQTVLTVTPKRVSLTLTDVGVLLVCVVGPSAVVTLLLLSRICCCSEGPPALQHHSPIEVIAGEEYFYTQTQHKHSACCCYFKDSEYDEDEYMADKLHEHTITESQC
nr:zgc:85923 [Danio rerio]